MRKIYYLLITVYRIVKYFFSKTKRYSNILIYILINRPQSILEIGVYRGLRSKEMIEAAKIFNNKIKYYGFDLFEELKPDILKKELSKIPVKKKYIYKNLSKIADVKLFKGYTNINLQKLKKKVDFVFIDGGHSVSTINSDWNNCKNFIKKNTIIIFDDYYIDNKNIIKKFGCNKTIQKIPKSKFEKKICNFTDEFIYLGKKLKIKMVYIKKL